MGAVQISSKAFLLYAVKWSIKVSHKSSQALLSSSSSEDCSEAISSRLAAVYYCISVFFMWGNFWVMIGIILVANAFLSSLINYRKLSVLRAAMT